MKWLFRIIGVILLLFIGLCVVGFTRPALQTVESSVSLAADRDTVYEIMANLKTYPEWAGLGSPNAEWVYGGAESGVGQNGIWKEGSRVGSLEILQAQAGEFVILKTIGPLGERTVTLAVDEMNETTIFLVQADRSLGGFPYLGRLAAWRQRGATQDALDHATDGMAQLFPANP